jgi:hypothetical protein
MMVRVGDGQASLRALPALPRGAAERASRATKPYPFAKALAVAVERAAATRL